LVDKTTNINHWDPALTEINNGSVVITWNGQGGSAVYGIVVNQLAVPIGPEFIVYHAPNQASFGNPRVAPL